MFSLIGNEHVLNVTNCGINLTSCMNSQDYGVYDNLVLHG